MRGCGYADFVIVDALSPVHVLLNMFSVNHFQSYLPGGALLLAVRIARFSGVVVSDGQTVLSWAGIGAVLGMGSEFFGFDRGPPLFMVGEISNGPG